MPELNWVPAPRYVLRRDRILRHLRDVAPCRVLDIGCGPGALISELSARGFETVGVDRSEKALELGRHLQSNSRRMELHAELDAHWKGTFDLLFSLEVIEHVADDVRALREWRQYLKPGGTMILSTPAHPNRWNAADEWAGHVRRYERVELLHKIVSAGFRVERIETYGFPVGNALEILAAPAYRRRLACKKQTHQDAGMLTDDSGSDRATHARFWSLYSGRFFTKVINAFCHAQRPFVNTDLGSGFLVVAKAV